MKPYALALIAAAFAGPALGQDSVQNASVVINQSGHTAALLAESGLKATAGVVAAPLILGAMAVGTAGSAAVTAGRGALDSANALGEGATGARRFARQPLQVDNDIIVAQPPPRVPIAAQEQR